MSKTKQKLTFPLTLYVIWNPEGFDIMLSEIKMDDPVTFVSYNEQNVRQTTFLSRMFSAIDQHMLSVVL